MSEKVESQEEVMTAFELFRLIQQIYSSPPFRELVKVLPGSLKVLREDIGLSTEELDEVLTVVEGTTHDVEGSLHEPNGTLLDALHDWLIQADHDEFGW